MFGSSVRGLIIQAALSPINRSQIPGPGSDDRTKEDEVSEKLGELLPRDEIHDGIHSIDSSLQKIVKLDQPFPEKTTLKGVLHSMSNYKRESPDDAINENYSLAQFTGSGLERETSTEGHEFSLLPSGELSSTSKLRLRKENTIEETPSVITLDQADDHISQRDSIRKSLLLPGLECAPAHQAWLERGSTADIGSRSPRCEKDNLSRMAREELHPQGSEISFDDAPAPRHLTKSPQFQVPPNGEMYGSTRHVAANKAQNRLLSPPGSCTEPRIRPEEYESRHVSPPAISLDGPRRAPGFEESNRSWRSTLKQDQSVAKLKSSQLEHVDVENQVMSGISAANSRLTPRQARANLNANHTVAQVHSYAQDQNLSSFSRLSSPNISDSTILKVRCAVSPGIVAKQVRSHWQGCSPTLPAPKKSLTTVSQHPSCQMSQPQSQKQLASQPRCIPTIPTLLLRSGFQPDVSLSCSGSQKRGSQSMISGNDAQYDSDDPTSFQARKATTAPALRQTFDTERELNIVRTRILAAEQRRSELADKHKFALLLKEERNKASKTLRHKTKLLM